MTDQYNDPVLTLLTNNQNVVKRAKMATPSLSNEPATDLEM